MFVSVIIPLFNKEQHIKRAISSVLNQTYTSFELIIVNDGSTDHSLEEVNKFDDTRIRVIDQVNGGVSKARNTGILHAVGDWVAFIDADDYWYKDFLETCVKLAQLRKGVLVGTNIEWAENRTALSSGDNHLVISDFCETGLHCPVPPVTSSSCMVLKDSLIEAGMFPEGISFGEDTDTWIRLSLQGDFLLSRSVHAVYDTSCEGSAVKKGIPCGKNYPIESFTYRRIRKELDFHRQITFRRYAQWRVMKTIDRMCKCNQWGSALLILLYNQTTMGFSIKPFASIINHLVQHLLDPIFSVTMRLQIRSRLRKFLSNKNR